MRTLREIGLKESDLMALLTASAAVREIVGVERIVLFGSKVRAADDDISDLDILILTSRPVTWQEKSRIVRLLSKIGSRFDVLFDPVIHSARDWNEGIPRYFPLHHEIENEGIPVI